MLTLYVVFLLSFVSLSLAAPHILELIDGNQEALGLPVGFTGLTAFIGVVIVAVAVGVLVAPLAPVADKFRARSKRPTRRNKR